MEEILILQMGGTIDKDYPKTRLGYNFEVGDPAVRRILARLRPSRSILTAFDTVCRKDSQDITDSDRSALVERISSANQGKIVITHGTDTMLFTATFLANSLREREINDKTIVITGSHTPEKFRDSDADFNVGVALGGVQAAAAGVWVTMNGILLPWDKIARDDTGQFVPRRPQLPITV
ncbi:glutaminase-asparaginase-like [Palaemon carinicauda]|uniref:glutaminase-asparaginase-like n=1 Tax=Palaemon carinicauda TaxID=392227 RepID=UPI0035B6195A